MPHRQIHLAPLTLSLVTLLVAGYAMGSTTPGGEFAISSVIDPQTLDIQRGRTFQVVAPIGPHTIFSFDTAIRSGQDHV